MEPSADQLTFILGMKLKAFRQDKGFSLKDLAEKTNLSISYLSEIEKGKKYPKPEKILHLASALGVQFDDLVSMKVDEALNPLKEMLSSPFIQEFPFHLFGIHPKELLHLILESPEKAGALVHTFLEIGRIYDVRVEHFLFAALRSFQQLNGNYFEDIENSAERFREELGWQANPTASHEMLQNVLTKKYGYVVEETAFEPYPELQEFRSVWVNSQPPKLFINSRLLPSQKAFIIGREIGYCYLGLVERATTSSWVRVESFEQVLNTFKASYFAGALLMHQDFLQQDLSSFFQQERWNGSDFLTIMHRYQATPEMFFYRLTEILPKLFGFREVYFLRLNNSPAEGDNFRLTKVLNMSKIPILQGGGIVEHFCRRWPSIKLLKELANRPTQKTPVEVSVQVGRTRFIEDQAEFFVITLARPLALSGGTNSSVTLGILLNDDFQKAVRFWNDPEVERAEVNLTCERCPLSPEQCQDRAAPPSFYQRIQRQERREQVLAQLISEHKTKGTRIASRG